MLLTDVEMGNGRSEEDAIKQFCWTRKNMKEAIFSIIDTVTYLKWLELHVATDQFWLCSISCIHKRLAYLPVLLICIMEAHKHGITWLPESTTCISNILKLVRLNIAACRNTMAAALIGKIWALVLDMAKYENPTSILCIIDVLALFSGGRMCKRACYIKHNLHVFVSAEISILACAGVRPLYQQQCDSCGEEKQCF